MKGLPRVAELMARRRTLVISPHRLVEALRTGEVGRGIVRDEIAAREERRRKFASDRAATQARFELELKAKRENLRQIEKDLKRLSGESSAMNLAAASANLSLFSWSSSKERELMLLESEAMAAAPDELLAAVEELDAVSNLMQHARLRGDEARSARTELTQIRVELVRLAHADVDLPDILRAVERLLERIAAVSAAMRGEVSPGAFSATPGAGSAV